MFAQLLEDHAPSDSDWCITPAQYDAWRRHFVFDGLRNLSYGQSFCRYFRIQDNILRFSQTVIEADEYIERYYLK
jgi:hypothetical protein